MSLVIYNKYKVLRFKSNSKDEIIQIVDSNQPEIIQQYLHEYTALLQNKIHQYQSDLDGQRLSTVPSLEFIDYRLSEFVRLHHRDLIRAIQLKKNQLTTHIAITRLSKQIASFKLTDEHVSKLPHSSTFIISSRIKESID